MSEYWVVRRKSDGFVYSHRSALFEADPVPEACRLTSRQSAYHIAGLYLGTRVVHVTTKKPIGWLVARSGGALIHEVFFDEDSAQRRADDMALRGTVVPVYR